MTGGFLDQRASLTGKVAVIIGGGGGLGRASTLDLARAGVHVVVCDRNEGALADTAAEVAALGASPVTATIDARDAEALSAFFTTLDDAHGRLDICVNVVGGTFLQSFADSNPRGWDAIIRTNFTAMLHATHLAIPRMRRSGGGSIINFTSIEGHRAAPGYAVYAGMKAAVTNFGRTLAVELAPEGIRVNTIAADQVPTEAIVAIRDEDWDDEVSAGAARIAIPMGTRGTLDDVGSCVLFLASDLSRYVTGTTLHPDGGVIASSGWFNWPGVGFRNSPPASAVEAVLGPPPPRPSGSQGER